MEDSGAILNQISFLKDSLDQVNEEIESGIQITREIESEIVRCDEMEMELAATDADLMKACYALEFEVTGLSTVSADSRASVKSLEEELCFQRNKRDAVLARIDSKREGFISSCQDFQRNMEGEGMLALLTEKESLANDYKLLMKKDSDLSTSVSAFVEDVLEELQSSISVLETEVQSRYEENQMLLKDIDDLKTALLSNSAASSG